MKELKEKIKKFTLKQIKWVSDTYRADDWCFFVVGVAGVTFYYIQVLSFF